MVQSNFTRNARAITSRLLEVSHLQCLGDSKGEPKRWGLVQGVATTSGHTCWPPERAEEEGPVRPGGAKIPAIF